MQVDWKTTGWLIKVINSCETIEQLDNAHSLGYRFFYKHSKENYFWHEKAFSFFKDARDRKYTELRKMELCK